MSKPKTINVRNIHWFDQHLTSSGINQIEINDGKHKIILHLSINDIDSLVTRLVGGIKGVDRQVRSAKEAFREIDNA